MNGFVRLAILGVAALGILWSNPSTAEACGAKLSLKGSKFHQARMAKASSASRQPIATGPIDTRQRDAKASGGVEGQRMVRTGGGETTRKRPRSKPVETARSKEVAAAPPVTDEPKSTKPLGGVDKRADKETAQPEPDTSGEEPTPPPREAKAKGKLPRLVFFANARAGLTPTAQAALDRAAAWMEANPDRSITIEGHASTRGNLSANQTLSERRAEAVKDYLVGKGVSESRINTVGRGSEQPEFKPGSNGKNRRVVIVPN